MKHELAIVIPAYNEETTVAATIEGFARQLPEALIVIVDNNSSDKTSERASSKIRELGCRGQVLFEKRQGKGMAIRKAFSEIVADYYVMADADSTYAPEDVHALLNLAVKSEYDMVVGDRHSGGTYKLQNTRQFHHFGNVLISRIINTLFNNTLSDILSGYRVFSRKFVKNYPILASGFEIETEMTLHALDKRFRMVEVPIRYDNRPQGSVSKLNTISDGMRILRTILWIFKDYRPLVFFGALAALSFLIGIVIGFPVLMEYAKYRYIYRIPSAVLSTGLMIVALLFFAVGLILDTVEKFHRFNYELQLLKDTPAYWRKAPPIGKGEAP